MILLRTTNWMSRPAALIATVLLAQGCASLAPSSPAAGSAAPSASSTGATTTATTPIPAGAVGSGATSAAPSHPYRGVFQSQCQPLTEGLEFVDRIELTPQGSTVAVQYRKQFFGGTGCKADTLLVTFNLPVSQWTVGEAVTLQGKPGHRITTATPDGQITATPARPGAVEDKGDTFVLRFGEGGSKQLPVEKKTQGGRTKELRLVDGDRLYVSDQTAANDTDYPQTVDFDFPYQRQ